MSRRKNAQGFTLIEVLVAIAVFASLSLAAYQVVNQVQLSNAQSLEKTARLQELQRALVFMDNDFRQMALRKTRSDGDAPSDKLLQYDDYLLDSDGKGVIFSRLGWQNPQQIFPRGEVTKVGYRIRNEKLERVWWRYSDTPAGQKPLSRPVLSQVESISMTFFDGNAWVKEWNKSKQLPGAVSMVLTLKDYGEVERIYLTVAGELQDSTSDDSSNSGGS